MLKTSLIINADDFGYSAEANRAIVATFSKGFCSSTTIMANMPGFEEACQMSHDNDLTKCIGLHLVLSEGEPLTDKIKKCPRFCNSEGYFRRLGKKRIFALSSKEKDALSREISAQIDRCRKFGIPLSHVDSHHHIHDEWGICSTLLGVVRSKNITYVRLSRSSDPNSLWIKNLYRRFFNFRLSIGGYAATKMFLMVEDYVQIVNKEKRKPLEYSFEVVVHPLFGCKEILIDKFSLEPLNQYVTKVDGYKNAVSFGDIANM